jgi:hypothetical protein
MESKGIVKPPAPLIKFQTLEVKSKEYNFKFTVSIKK